MNINLFLLSTILFFGQSAIGAEVLLETEVLRGAEIVNNNCSRCHNSRATNEFTDDEWAVVMPHMRTRAHLTGGEAADVVSYMQFIQENQESRRGTSIGNSDGESLLNEYACLGCHSLAGNGGRVAVSLDGVIDRLGESFFRKKVKDPQFNNSATPMPNLGISDSEIELMIEYLRGR